jgi:hypothetical protein
MREDENSIVVPSLRDFGLLAQLSQRFRARLLLSCAFGAWSGFLGLVLKTLSSISI